jgi:hypothetical protein
MKWAGFLPKLTALRFDNAFTWKVSIDEPSSLYAITSTPFAFRDVGMTFHPRRERR